MNIATGTRIKHYEIESRLGAGGMGQVYLAEDTQLRRKVAIKFLLADTIADERAKSRLLREARAAATLDHPNICAIYEIGEEGGRNFIVLQYVEGETLAAKLKSNPLDLRTSLAIAAQIADALAEAHKRGIIHRDIKPENIMIAARNQVKVLDFGLAKVIYNDDVLKSEAETISKLSMPGLIIGTVPYLSPEQIRGEELDCRSDIFSFGILLYELFCGRRPFNAKSQGEIISAILTQQPEPFRSPLPALRPKLEWLVLKCLEKDPARRYQKMDHLIVDLEQIRLQSESARASNNKIESAMTLGIQTATLKLQRLRLNTSKQTYILAVIAIAAVAFFSVFWSWSRPSKSSPIVKTVPSLAYDDYVRGKVKVRNENPEDNAGAIKLLEKAIAADPNYAPAYAELARAYSIRAFQWSSKTEQKQLIEDAEVAIQKALALDPNLAETHHARGLILWSQAKGFPHTMAIQSYKRALALNPNLDETHHQLALIYLHIGLFEMARDEVAEALAFNPSNIARFRIGAIDLYSGKYEDALDIFKSIPKDFQPANRQRAEATALFQLGRTEESEAAVEDFLKTYPSDEGGLVTSVKAMLLAKNGKQRQAEDAIQHAIEIGKDFGHFHHTAYNVASAYALLNKPEQAVKWLQFAADNGFPCYPLFENDASLNNVRTDPQFIAFLKKQKQQWERYKTTL